MVRISGDEGFGRNLGFGRRDLAGIWVLVAGFWVSKGRISKLMTTFHSSIPVHLIYHGSFMAIMLVRLLYLVTVIHHQQNQSSDHN